MLLKPLLFIIAAISGLSCSIGEGKTDGMVSYAVSVLALTILEIV